MYPNEPCNECEDQENDLPPLEDPCTDLCERIVQSQCINYSGPEVLCDDTPLLQPGQNLSTILENFANQICSGVEGIAATINVGTTAINIVNFDDPAVINIVNSGTTSAAVFDFTFDIPGCEPCDPVVAQADDSTEHIVDTGSDTFTFDSPITGPYNWGNGSRLRASASGGQIMEGVVTAHSASSVTINVDWISGSGTGINWSIALIGEPGSTGATGTMTANSPATVNDVAHGQPATVAIVNSGTPEAAVLDFTFDIPAANSVASATIDAAGDLLLTLDDATVINAGSATGPGVVAGGTANQILKKVDGTDFNTYWGNEDASAHVIAGGQTGYLLGKNSATDYDLGWIAPQLAPAAPATSAGSPVPQVYVSSEAELIAALDQFNTVDGGAIGYLGANIHLAANITLTQNITSEFDGIEIIGDGVRYIDVQSGATNYYFICTSGSPKFTNVVFKNTFEQLATGGINHKRVLELNNTGATASVVEFNNCLFDDIVMNGGSSTILLTDAPMGSELVIDNCAIQSKPAVDVLTPIFKISMVIESASAAYEGGVTIKDMRFTRATNQGEGNASAALTPGDEISTIYFNFIGTWGQALYNVLNIDMESYALTLGLAAFSQGTERMYIRNSMFMYVDNDNTLESIKPNEFGNFGYINPEGLPSLDGTTYT
jgi:hypothetical protein